MCEVYAKILDSTIKYPYDEGKLVVRTKLGLQMKLIWTIWNHKAIWTMTTKELEWRSDVTMQIPYLVPSHPRVRTKETVTNFGYQEMYKWKRWSEYESTMQFIDCTFIK